MRLKLTETDFRKIANKILLEYMAKKNNVWLSLEVEDFATYFIEHIVSHMDKFTPEVVEKPSILNRIGKRLGLCT